jgi:uncharacterized protein YciI
MPPKADIEQILDKRVANDSHNRPQVDPEIKISYSTTFVAGRMSFMFVVLLKFSDNKGQAGQFMEGHKEWLKSGFDDDVFLLAGSLQPNLGGGIVAHNTSLSDLQNRVNDDPFVAENVVKAEILEISPSKADERLNFLLD